MDSITERLALLDDNIVEILRVLCINGDWVFANRLAMVKKNMRTFLDKMENPIAFDVEVGKNLIAKFGQWSSDNAIIYWGDGTSEVIGPKTINPTHFYASPGIYRIRVFDHDPVQPIILPINVIAVHSIGKQTKLSSFLWGCEHFDSPLLLDTKKVTDMNHMFCKAYSFNQSLKWNVGSVIDMSYMFYGAHSFNQPLDWDVGSVTNMRGMFYGAHSFNQPLDWDVGSVTNMSFMFCHARKFNQPLEWDVSSDTDTGYMFCGANQSLK